MKIIKLWSSAIVLTLCSVIFGQVLVSHFFSGVDGSKLSLCGIGLGVVVGLVVCIFALLIVWAGVEFISSYDAEVMINIDEWTSKMVGQMKHRIYCVGGAAVGGLCLPIAIFIPRYTPGVLFSEVLFFFICLTCVIAVRMLESFRLRILGPVSKSDWCNKKGRATKT